MIRAALLSIALCAAGPAAAQEVLVLRQEGFPSLKATTLSPESLLRALHDAGIDARFADVEQAALRLADTDDPPAALVSTYGNTFPQALGDPSASYLSNGGIAATNGIAFVHPTVLRADGWHSIGHDNSFPERLGAGSFDGTRSDTVAPAPLGEALGFGEAPWDRIRLLEPLQGPDASTVPEGAEFEPILAAADGTAHAAIVRPPSGGSVIWYGTTDFGGPAGLSGALMAELAVRSLAHEMARSGLLAQEAAEAILAAPLAPEHFAELEKAYAPVPFPGDRAGLYPTVAQAPRELLVLDASDSILSKDEQLLAISAQGILNASSHDGRHAYLLQSGHDAHWLEYMEDHAYIEGIVRLGGLGDLLDEASPRGAVLVPEHPSQAIAYAQLLAERDHVVLVRDRATAERHGIPIVHDLAGRWASNAAMYEAALQDFAEDIDRRAVAVYHPVLVDRLRDYLIANRIFTFWVTGPGEADAPGSDAVAEERLLARVLAEEFPVNIPALGYPWAGHGIGLGEGRGVAFLSNAGKFLVPTDHLGNLSTLTATPRQEGAFPSYEFDRSRVPSPGGVYASLVISDGDNLCTWVDFFPNYIAESRGGGFPLALTVGSSIGDLLPPVADALARGMADGHSLGVAVSGVGYIYPRDYGLSFGEERGAVLRGFAALTEQTAADLGLDWMWMMGYGGPGSAMLREFVGAFGRIRDFIGGYGLEALDMAESVESLGESIVFHAVTHGEDLARMKEQIDGIAAEEQRPLFLHVFLVNWYITPAEIRELVEHMRAHGMEVVAPEELASLARRHAESSP